ncbi:MAG: DUF899 family protein [Acidobacteriota bacterium]
MDREIERLEHQILELKKRLAELRRERPPTPVRDYELVTSEGGSVRLSELFGTHSELVVVHNMGRGCSYCTLWADGFNGVFDHLENRAPFVVASPDSPAEQSALATARGWRFPMVSTRDSEFTQEMGFGEEGAWLPGASFFRRGEAGIERTGWTSFGPGDDFCSPWHLFELLPDGVAGWEPKMKY